MISFMSLRVSATLLAILVICTTAAAGQAVDPATAPLTAVLPTDPAVRVGVLPNGLRYYVRANGWPEKRAELQLVVNAGSILEDDDQRGLAHFVEHMAFNGTRNFSKSAIVDFLELSGMRFGADVNAYTSFDETVYMLQLPTDSAAVLQQGLRILVDWAGGVTFDSVEVEKERGVVVEEWRLGRGASSRIQDKQLPVLLKDSRYAVRLPIGSDTSLRGFSREALLRFYRDWYRPDLMAVIAVGDFDAAEMESRIREMFSALVSPASPRARPRVVVPDHDATLVMTATDPEETNTNATIYFKRDVRQGRTLGDYRRDIVAALFDGLLNERYYEASVKPDAPFIYAFGGESGLVRTKEAYAVGVGVKDGGVERGLEAALLETRRVASFGFTSTELERAKANTLRGMEQLYAERAKAESPRFASEYTRAFLQGESFPGIEFEYELYKRFIPEISLEELNALAGELLPAANRVILVSGPQAGGDLPSTEKLTELFAAVDRSSVSAYVDNVSEGDLLPSLPTPGTVASVSGIVELGVTEWRLSNGARVILRPTDFKADEIRLAAFSPGGSSLASDADAFVAENATLAISLGGIGSFDQVELGKKLAGKAVGAGPFIGSLEEGMSASASPRDAEEMFQLIHLYFTAPRRDSSAFEAFRESARASMLHQSADPGSMFSDTATRVLTNYHPRVRLVDAAMLDSLDLDRSIAFYKERFADASDFTFLIVGAFTPDSIKPLVERYIASLPSINRTESWRDNGVRPPEGVVKRVVRRGLEPKSETSLIFTGPAEYTRANRFALSSLAEVLNIRLREVLREELGGTYSVGVSGSAAKDPWASYSFSISYGSAPERADSMATAVFSNIARIKDEGPTQVEVDKVKETLRRSYETNMKQNGYWLGQLMAYYRMGEDPRQLLSYEEVLNTLTPALVKEAAVRFLRTDNYIHLVLMPER